MATVASPIYTLTYNGKDISKSIAEYLISLVFEDAVEGEASSLDIELDNTDQLWSNGWYPEKGATLTASIGNMDCGEFTMDEIELRGKPDVIIMKALSNVIDKKALKTKRSRGHRNKTLLQIAQATAQANGLTLVGSVPNIPIENVNQRRETDLKFLRRVSYSYGIVFSVRSKKLVFTSLIDLDKRKAALVVDKTDMSGYSIKDKTDKSYVGAVVRSHNPRNRTVVSGSSSIETLQNTDGVKYTQITGADRLVIHQKAENSQQAEAMADAHFYRANSWLQSGSFDAPGNELYIAGNNVALTGLGIVGSGIYNMAKVTHTVDRANSWTASTEIKRVCTVSKIKQRGAKIVRPAKAVSNQVLTLQNADAVKFTQIIPVDSSLGSL